MPYSIIKADLDRDKEQIIALWKRNFPDVPEERYEWIYKNNPSGPASCFLLKDIKNDCVVGAISLFPKVMSIKGIYFKAAITGDFIVDKNHRTLGPALLLKKSAMSNSHRKEYKFFYGFPNKKSQVPLILAGYNILGEIITLTKPLKSIYHIKKYFGNPVAIKMASKGVDFLMSVLSKENIFRSSGKYSFEILASFDERFDLLWDKASVKELICGERNSRYLNWKYKQSPLDQYYIFAMIEKESKFIHGYIVYSIRDNKVNIVDFLSLNMGETLDFLLAEFLIFQRKEGLDSVTIRFIGNRAFSKKFLKYGFSIRSKNDKLLIYVQHEFPYSHYMMEKENWYLLSGDSDI